MNADDFEKELQRQPLRPVPPNWRTEILAAARAASPEGVESKFPAAGSWWRELLWPCPQAWAGLAAVWILIAMLHFTEADREDSIAAAPGSEPTLQAAESAAQRRELVRWLENIPDPAPAPPRIPPGPRSETVSPPRA